MKTSPINKLLIIASLLLLPQFGTTALAQSLRCSEWLNHGLAQGSNDLAQQQTMRHNFGSQNPLQRLDSLHREASQISGSFVVEARNSGNIQQLYLGRPDRRLDRLDQMGVDSHLVRTNPRYAAIQREIQEIRGQEYFEALEFMRRESLNSPLEFQSIIVQKTTANLNRPNAIGLVNNNQVSQVYVPGNYIGETLVYSIGDDCSLKKVLVMSTQSPGGANHYRRSPLRRVQI
jgi:hypothetical protein